MSEGRTTLDKALIKQRLARRLERIWRKTGDVPQEEINAAVADDDTSTARATEPWTT